MQESRVFWVSSEGKSSWKARTRLQIIDKITGSLSALGVPIANALLVNGLRSQVPKFTSSVSSEAVIRAGALNLQSLTISPDVLHSLREAYALAISHVNIFLVSVICISVPTACGMEWLNIKKISAQREGEKARMTDENVFPEGLELR